MHGNKASSASAGTSAIHVGERPHTLSIKVAGTRDIQLAGQICRQVQRADFQEYDLILGMDRDNVCQLHSLSPASNGVNQKARIDLYLDFAGLGLRDVPDPWGKDERDYESVANTIDAASPSILARLMREF